MLRLPAALCSLLLAICSFAAPGKIFLGHLGQAMSATRIYASPNSRSRIFYHVRASEYLVVKNGHKPEWLQVLLQNGVYGFVPSKAVNVLPYDVTTGAKPSRKTNDLASRSYGAAIGDDSLRTAIANYATQFKGTPYRFGGEDIGSGIDCSAFVKKMYGKIGVELPRTAAEQALVGQPVLRLQDLRAGDRLYFWDKKRGKIGHTGIYRGDGTFVHSSHGKGGVAVSDLTESWCKILVAARR